MHIYSVLQIPQERLCAKNGCLLTNGLSPAASLSSSGLVAQNPWIIYWRFTDAKQDRQDCPKTMNHEGESVETFTSSQN